MNKSNIIYKFLSAIFRDFSLIFKRLHRQQGTLDERLGDLDLILVGVDPLEEAVQADEALMDKYFNEGEDAITIPELKAALRKRVLDGDLR